MTQDRRQLYLDCDGVLADFERGARELLGMPVDAYIARHGAGRFWQQLARAPEFYGTLPPLPDAMELFDAVRHLHPVILTGLPRGTWAAPQKVQWAARHFPGTRIITCMAVDKRKHAHPGDVLVDDMPSTARPGKTRAASSSTTAVRRRPCASSRAGSRWPRRPPRADRHTATRKE